MENTEDGLGDVDMNCSAISFDNLTILREFGNIANLVRLVFFGDSFLAPEVLLLKGTMLQNNMKKSNISHY